MMSARRCKSAGGVAMMVVAVVVMICAGWGWEWEARVWAQMQQQINRESLVETLAKKHARFAQVIEAVDEDRLIEAMRLLEGLVKDKDEQLAQQAGLMLARLQVEQGEYREARLRLEVLVKVTGPKLLDDGEALFLLGVTQGRLMERAASKATLEKFLQEHPSAPERLRVSAQVRLREMAAMEEGSLRDVADRMDFSRRQLARSVTDESTLETQGKIVELLDKLIKAAQDKEAAAAASSQSAKGGTGPAAGNSNPSSPAQQSTAPVGEARMGELRGTRRDPAEDWLRLQDRERQQVLDTLKGQFPERYRELVEQYYRNLADESEE